MHSACACSQNEGAYVPTTPTAQQKKVTLRKRPRANGLKSAGKRTGPPPPSRRRSAAAAVTPTPPDSSSSPAAAGGGGWAVVFSIDESRAINVDYKPDPATDMFQAGSFLHSRLVL